MGSADAVSDSKPRARLRWLKPLVYGAALLPLGKVVLDGAWGRLGANPIEAALNRLGFWALAILLGSLACTPLQIVLRRGWPVRIRRGLGLIAFLYAALHFSTYVGVDQFFDFSEIGKDIVKRKFITVGFAAFLLLVPLALTSTKKSIQRLGARRWKALHRLVYVAATLGVIHFVWRVKADLLEPLLFAAALALLLGIRLVARRRPASAGRATSSTTG